MTSDSVRRLIETSSPDISDSELRLIETMDRDPASTLNGLERLGYNTGRPEFVGNYLHGQKRRRNKKKY